MEDREILELAAKASGFVVVGEKVGRSGKPWLNMSNGQMWNAFEDDGDAFRLAVDLFITIHEAVYDHCEFNLCDYPDRREATRKAIVYAASEIGKAMP